MKKFIYSIVLTLSLAGACAAHATIGNSHHQLIISSSLRYIVASGTVNNVVTVPVNNQTIIQAIVSGTVGLAAQQLDIAIDDVTAEIDVIKKSDKSILFVIGQADGTTSTDAELHSNNPNAPYGFEVITGFLISLPGKPGPAREDLVLSLKNKASNPAEFSHLTTRFFAGFDEGQPDSYILTGTAVTTAKVYNY